MPGVIEFPTLAERALKDFDDLLATSRPAATLLNI